MGCVTFHWGSNRKFLNLRIFNKISVAFNKKKNTKMWNKSQMYGSICRITTEPQHHIFKKTYSFQKIGEGVINYVMKQKLRNFQSRILRKIYYKKGFPMFLYIRLSCFFTLVVPLPPAKKYKKLTSLSPWELIRTDKWID